MADNAREYSDLPETYISKDNLPEPYAAPNQTLEAVQKSEEKKVARTREDDAPEVTGADQYDDREAASGPAQRRRKLRWILVAAAVVTLALALGLGLGVGLSPSE